MGPTEAAASRLLESLPARPPTPPREMHHEPELLPKQVGFLDPRSSLQTPPSIHSPHPASKTRSTGSRKKVEFSAQPHYQEAPVYPGDIDVSSRQGRSTPPIAVIPPSSSTSKPAKSILKATAYEATIAYDSTQPASSVLIADMLASTVQQLAGADRDSKLDAYLTLARALKASDNLPDRIALQSKMTLFTHFIQRDITSARTATGTLDSTLVLAALDLLNTFLRFSAIASTLSNDFGVFIIDHCIRSFEVVEVPRTVLRALMRVVGLQSFPPKVMTSDRVGRLVVALHDMEEQMESRNTLLLRCMIYRTLVRNNQILMAQHMDWLPDLFTDMLSSAPVIREAAISLGLDAGFALARERPVTQRVLELFQTTIDDEIYFEYYANSLVAMTKDKDDSPYVPQVWSVVTLFIRSVEKWDYFNPWLRIIQGCFNTCDYRTKIEANYAWARLAYAGMRDHRILPTKMAAIMTKALVSQLRRRGGGKPYDDHRRVVIGTICNLYYYSMRPNTEPRALDSAWDLSVKPVILQLLEQPAVEEAKEKQKANRETASALLTGLINCSVARPWQEDHVVKSPLVLPEDLPAVDAKWVRRNSARVFVLVGPIVRQGFLDLATPRSSTQTLWRAVVGAAAVAAAKEVKVSTETAVFVSHAFSLLLEIWTAGVSTAAQTDDGDKSFAAKQMLAATREFLLTMVDALGSLPFTEKQLAKDERNAFVAVGTPSQRTGKSHSLALSPLHHLFAILSSLPPGVQDNDDFADFIECVLAPFFSAKSGKGRQILALGLLQTIPADVQCPYGPWQAVAKRIASSMDEQTGSAGGSGNGSNSLGTGAGYNQFQLSPGSGSGDGTPVGYQYRDVVRVLERGLRSTPELPFSRWQALFCTLCDRVREDTGDAGLAMCVLDPLAKAIADLCSRFSVDEISATASRAVVELLSSATQPRDRQAVDAAKRRLWGTAIATANSTSSSEPLEHLYAIVSVVLKQQYGGRGSHKPASNGLLASLLGELGRFFARGNDQLFVKTLAAVQDGLALWIRDGSGLLSRQNPATEATKLVWDELCTLLERMSNQDNFPLDALEPLFSAAFTSKHKSIVNRALGLWTNNYGGYVGTIDYPEKLRKDLAALQPFIDIAIPGLEASLVDTAGALRPVFIDDSQNDTDVDADVSLPPMNIPDQEVPTPQAVSSSYKAQSPFAIPLSLPARRQSEALATTSPSFINTASNGEQLGGRRGAKQKKAKVPKPRHDDSQIEFTMIDSTAGFPSSSSAGKAAKDSESDEASTDESQILTERQREVRERQRETNALYSDMTSSTPTRAETRALAPEDESTRSLSPMQDDVQLPEQVQVITPETHNAGYAEEFIASTPTPRRGQTLTLAANDNDNDNDPPSSPPEPRRYPLLPEMGARSRSSSSSMLEEWPFSSSPVAGSPMAAHHTAPEPELSLEGLTEADEEDETDRATEQSFEGDERPAAASRRRRSEGPSTPTRRSARSLQKTPPTMDSRRAAIRDATKSSPIGRQSSGRRRIKIMATQSPAAAAPIPSQSFLLSDGDERSMLRLAMELDQRRPHSSPAETTSRSVSGSVDENGHVRDCITVFAGDESDGSASARMEGGRRLRKRKRTAGEEGGEGEGGDEAQPDRSLEDEEVQSQLALEVQERNERLEMVERQTTEEAEEGADGRPAKRTRLTGILSMLMGSLAMLKTAALSRGEVHEIEDVCMDIKRELYDAELRGRRGEQSERQ